MAGARVAFDSNLPAVVASFDLVLGPQRFKRGDALPWRDLKVSEFDLLQLYLAQQVDFAVPPSQAATVEPPPPASVQSPEAAAVVIATGLDQFAEAEPKRLTAPSPSPKAERRGRSR